MALSDTMTGWEFHRRTHFDEIVENYDKARPDYPRALFPDVLAYAGMKPGMRALEIGAGTGKATGPFLEAGCAVTAVEMGAQMAAFLGEKYSSFSTFNVVNATFEEAVLEEGVWDLVYAASAFHWVDHTVGLPKVMRLLRSGGVLALIRYNDETDVNDALSKDMQKAYDEHYLSFYTAKKLRPNRSRGEYAAPALIEEGYGFADMAEYGFKDVALSFYDASITYTADAYIAILETLADHRALPEEHRMALYAGIREAIARHGGQARQDMLFQLYMGRKP